MQSNSLHRILPPRLTHTRIILQRHRQPSQQQRRPIHHTQLLWKIQHPILPMQFLMPAMVQMLTLEPTKHESPKVC